MCLICIDFQKQKMTINDAKRALREMVEVLDEDHVEEVREMIAKAEEEARSNDDSQD